MPDSVSRLVIVVDSKDSKREVDSLDKSLVSAEKQGDKTSKSIKKMGGETKATTDLFSKFKDQINASLGNTQIGSTLGDVTQKVSGLRGSVALAAAGLAGLAVGGIAVTLAGLSAMAIQSAKADAEMLVLANRANIGAKNFQVLAHASEQLGVSQDQLGSIFADVQEKLGEFSATKGGGAADFFEALQNNTKMTDAEIKNFSKTLQGKDGVESVQLLKDKLDEVGASAQEQRFVFESLGSDLGNLLPLFENGGDLLSRYGEALEEAGIIKSKEAIEQSRLLAAQTKSVQTRFEGFKTQLASQMMPILNSLLSSFLQGTKNGGQFGSVIQSVGTIAKGVAVGIIGLAGAIQTVIRLIQGFVEQAANIGMTYANVISADGVVAKGKALVNGFKEGWSIASDTVSDSVSTIKNSMNAMNGVLDASVPKLDELGQLYYDTSGAIDNTNDGLKTNAEDAKNSANASRNAAQASKKHAQELNKVLEEQLKIRYEYSDKSKQIEMDLQKEIERLQKYGMTQFISTAIQRANDTKLINDAQLAYDLYSFKMNEQEKLTAKTRIEDLRISKSQEYNDEEKKSRLKALKEQYDYESSLINLAAEQRKRAYEQTYTNSLRSIQQARAILAAPNSQREGLSTFFGEKNALSDNESTLLATNDALKMQLEQREITTLEYNKRIEDAVRLHEETKWKIQEEYAEKYQDLQKGQYESQLQIWSSLLNQGQSVWSNLTQSVKDASGEQAQSYKTMFAMQQAFAIASTIVSAHLAASQTTADITLPFIGKIPAASAILAFGYAQAGMIAGQTIAGMAHNGMDNIPKEGTWLLDGGERVVSPRQNQDLTNFLATQRERNQMDAINSGGSVSGGSNVIQPQVVINNNAPARVSTQTGSDGKLYVTIDEVENFVSQSLGMPNSRISKSLTQNTNAGRRR